MEDLYETCLAKQDQARSDMCAGYRYIMVNILTTCKSVTWRWQIYITRKIYTQYSGYQKTLYIQGPNGV